MFDEWYDEWKYDEILRIIFFNINLFVFIWLEKMYVCVLFNIFCGLM